MKVNPPTSSLPQWWSGVREAVAYVGIAMALLLGGLGQFITFVPGAAMGWYATAAGFAVAGLLSSRWRLRLVALVLVVGLAGLSWAGYLEGLRYHEYLRQQ